MVITRKIELHVVGDQEERDHSWELLRYYNNTIPRLNNFVVTEIFLNDLVQEKMARHFGSYEEGLKKLDDKVLETLEAIKTNNTAIKENKGNEKKQVQLEKKKVKLTKEYEAAKKKKNSYIAERKKEARDIFKDAFGKTIDGAINERIRGMEEFKELPDTIVSPAIAELGFYRKELYKIKMGEERIRMYSKGMPFNSRGRDLKLIEDDEDIYINWVKGIRFKIHFGKDKSDNRTIINRVLSGAYKLCDSKIQLKGKKIFLLASVDIPQNKNEFLEDRVLGVDLGIKYPAYFALNDKEFIRGHLGSYEDFFKVRTQMQSRRKRLQKAVKFSTGGRGRTKKLKALRQFEDKERNWARTYNHSISKGVIDAALKYKAGVISLEDLKKTGFDKDSKILRNWSYYELQQFIEYKAKKEGITVIKVDPAYTSQACSQCGHTEKENRQTQEQFKCTSCGFEENADYNAARNIAKKANS